MHECIRKPMWRFIYLECHRSLILFSEKCVAKLVHGVLLLYLVDISLHYNYNTSWL